jgi:hypothetical protein
VQTRINRLRADLVTHRPLDVDEAFISEHILKPLANAEYLARIDPQDARERITGSQIEAAWLEVRHAQDAMLRAAPKDEAVLKANAAKARSDAKGRVANDDTTVTELEKALADKPADLARIRELTVRLNGMAHDLSDKEHREQRKFQNQLRFLTVCLAALTAGIVGALWAVPTLLVDLLPAPPGMSMGVAALVAVVCGAIGALISAIPSLSTYPDSTSSPYNPIREQAGLKITVGGISGLLGPILVAAGLTINVDGKALAVQAGTAAGFVMLSALCGAQQEAITRFADRKASSVTPK